MDEILLMRGMTDMQSLMFQSEMGRRRKSATTALLLTLFLGHLGAHRFYLGQIGLGLLYLFTVWTFIPFFAALVELFLIRGRVEKYNLEQATEVAMRVRALAANNPAH